jgi:hypothetical protein
MQPLFLRMTLGAFLSEQKQRYHAISISESFEYPWHCHVPKVALAVPIESYARVISVLCAKVQRKAIIPIDIPYGHLI